MLDSEGKQAQYGDITGIDNSVPPPNDWVEDLENHTSIGNFNVQYQGGDETERYARIVEDPTNSENNVLKFWLKYPNVEIEGTDRKKGRIQTNIYRNKNLMEIYQKVRLYVGEDFNILRTAPEKFTWLTLMEFWNNGDWASEGYPFRVTLDIAKLEDEPAESLFFLVHGEVKENSKWQDPIWYEVNSGYPVPIGEWITLETYFKEGDENTGRFYFAVTPENGKKTIIFDINNYTQHPDDPAPDGLLHYNPMKLYTSGRLIDYVRNNGGVLQIYWDDFELWKDRGPEN